MFDVLGKVQFEGRPLRELLIQAIRYGEQEEVRARLTRVVTNAFDPTQLQDLIEERALVHDAMDASRVYRIREEMERAEARRLQPHYVEGFFLEAFGRLGGAARQREPRRHEITHGPAPVRNRDRAIGTGEPVLARYEHLAEVKSRKIELIDKTEAAVKDRLTKEINYWDLRAEDLRLQEQAGKANARLNSQEARRQADDLYARLEKRLGELRLERQVSSLLPVVIGGVLVVPAGLIAAMTGRATPARATGADTQAAAARGRAIVMEVERGLGYDIESRVPGTGKLRFIEVKERVAGAETVTVTKNEILYWLNRPDDFILALVEFRADGGHDVRYLRRPFQREPDFGVTSVNYDFRELLARAEAPS